MIHGDIDQIIRSLARSRQGETEYLKGLTTILLYECAETGRREVMRDFLQKYKGMVRGAYMRADKMYLVVKEEQRPCEVIAVGEVPEKYKGKIPLSVILPSAYHC